MGLQHPVDHRHREAVSLQQGGRWSCKGLISDLLHVYTAIIWSQKSPKGKTTSYLVYLSSLILFNFSHQLLFFLQVSSALPLFMSLFTQCFNEVISQCSNQQRVLVSLTWCSFLFNIPSLFILFEKGKKTRFEVSARLLFFPSLLHIFRSPSLSDLPLIAGQPDSDETLSAT